MRKSSGNKWYDHCHSNRYHLALPAATARVSWSWVASNRVQNRDVKTLLAVLLGVAASAAVAIPVARRVRRSLLRRLLAMSVGAKAPKWVFGGISVLSPAAPSMLYFQDLLPPLPVPDLTATCDDFVRSVATLVSAEELAQLRAGLADFCATNGPNVQKLLMERAKVWVWLGVGCCRVPVRSGGAWLTRPSILVATNGRCSCRFLGPVCTARLDCPV